jgi:DUF971 family protein
LQEFNAAPFGGQRSGNSTEIRENPLNPRSSAAISSSSFYLPSLSSVVYNDGMQETTPIELKKIGQEQFKITWKDGHISIFPFRYLRQSCPCAACKDEMTGRRTLDPESIPVDLKGLRADLVGNYALHFSFSDHHETGIFSFQFLRSICSWLLVT